MVEVVEAHIGETLGENFSHSLCQFFLPLGFDLLVKQVFVDNHLVPIMRQVVGKKQLERVVDDGAYVVDTHIFLHAFVLDLDDIAKVVLQGTVEIGGQCRRREAFLSDKVVEPV